MGPLRSDRSKAQLGLTGRRGPWWIPALSQVGLCLISHASGIKSGNMFQNNPLYSTRAILGQVCLRASAPDLIKPLKLSCEGLLAAGYHDLLAPLLDASIKNFSLGFEEQEMSRVFPHTTPWMIKSPSPLKTHKRPTTVCPAEHIWGQPEFTRSSMWIWTGCCDTALVIQSLLALA